MLRVGSYVCDGQIGGAVVRHGPGGIQRDPGQAVVAIRLVGPKELSHEQIIVCCKVLVAERMLARPLARPIPARRTRLEARSGNCLANFPAEKRWPPLAISTC